MKNFIELLICNDYTGGGDSYYVDGNQGENR
jgi:hypothetical protein